MSRRQRIRLVAAGAAALANVVAVHKGNKLREQNEQVQELLRTPFDTEWYSNRYNR
jgi:hypothetical protein